MTRQEAADSCARLLGNCFESTELPLERFIIIVVLCLVCISLRLSGFGVQRHLLLQQESSAPYDLYASTLTAMQKITAIYLVKQLFSNPSAVPDPWLKSFKHRHCAYHPICPLVVPELCCPGVDWIFFCMASTSAVVP